jgi:diguanylate cyclase (GGDEF)-like protein
MFCTAIFDIDGFQRVNEKHGHWVGDQLLKQFAAELRSACRSTDIVGRWGGDEFIVVLDYGLQDAKPQIDRLSSWVSGAYKVPGRMNDLDIRVDVSVGIAEHRPGERLQDLLDRVDADMKPHKAAPGCLKLA